MMVNRLNRRLVSISTELLACRGRLFFYFNNAFICPSSQHQVSIYVYKAVVITIFLSTDYVPAPMPRTLCALSQFPQHTYEIVLLAVPTLQKRILNVHFSKILKKWWNQHFNLDHLTLESSVLPLA